MSFEQKPTPIQEQPSQPEETPSPEKELSSEQRTRLAYELLHVTPDELAQLKDRIQANQGHVHINMHPFYGAHHNSGLNALELSVQTEASRPSKGQAFMEEGILRVASHVAKTENTAPLIIFEEAPFMLDTKARLSEKLGLTLEELSSRGLFFVPTLYDAGVIAYDEATRVHDQAWGGNLHEAHQKLITLEQSILAQTRAEVMNIKHTAKSREELEVKQAAFLAEVIPLLERVKENIRSLQKVSQQVLATLMTELGVQSVNLSGGFFKKETKAKQDFYLMAGGCAGYLRNQLRSQDIKVNLSRYTVPPRGAIGKLDPVTKDTRDLSQSSPAIETSTPHERESQSQEKGPLELSESESAVLTQEFFGISAAELALLKERLLKNEGHARMFVHPFFVHKYPDSYIRRAEKGDYGERTVDAVMEYLEKGFLRMVESAIKNPQSAPLIVFEEQDRVEETKKTLREKLGDPTLNFSEHGIVFSATGQSTGDPENTQVKSAFEKAKGLKKEENLRNAELREIYGKIILTLGVQSGTLGGVYFDDWYRPEDKLAACAGSVRRLFNELDIPIDMSRYSISPREQLKVHYQTKQTRRKKEEIE